MGYPQLWLVGLAVSLCCASGAEAALTLEFDSGSSASGPEMTWTGSWAMVAFAPDQPAYVDASLPSGFGLRLKNETEIAGQLRAGGSYAPPTSWQEGPQSARPTHLVARAFEDWAAIYIEAADLRIDLVNASLDFHATSTTACIDDWLRQGQQILDWLPRDACHEMAGPGVLARQLDTEMRQPAAVITSSGPVRLLLHNFENSCSTPGPCPSGGFRKTTSIRSGSEFVSIQERGYAEVTAPRASIRLEGMPEVILQGGTLMEGVVQGNLRLPMAEGAICAGLAGCVVGDDQTLRAGGNIRVDSLGAAGPGRLGATLSGDDLTLRLDETWLSAPASKLVAASGLAVLLAALAKVVAGGLGTKIRPDPLAHANRRKLYDYIIANPGATFREIVRGTGIPTGTARHHLAVMSQASAIREHGHKATLRYFENHGRFDESWNTVVMPREPELRRLHDWLLVHPGSMQREVLDAASEAWGWSRSTTQHRLGRLASEGLIDVKLQGRLKLYTAQSRAPVPTAEAKQSNTDVAVG